MRDLRAAIEAFPEADEIVWVQEEPENMGAWDFIRPHLHEVSDGRPVRRVARPRSASPAEGSRRAHTHHQQVLIAQAFGGKPVARSRVVADVRPLSHANPTFMPSNIVVPEVGESIVDARVAKWLRKEGDAVAAGDPLVELETDKIDLEVSAPQAGVLSRIDHQDGEDVKVGEVLGMLDESAKSAATPSAAAPHRAERGEGRGEPPMPRKRHARRPPRGRRRSRTMSISRPCAAAAMPGG